MIVIVAPGFLDMPVETYGGIEKVIQQLSRGFIENGNKVVILTPTKSAKPEGVYIHISRKNFQFNCLNYIKKYKKLVTCVIINHSSHVYLRNGLTELRLPTYEIGHWRNFTSTRGRIYPSKALWYMAPTIRPYGLISHPINMDVHKPDTEINVTKLFNLPSEYLVSIGRVCPYKRTKMAYKYAKALGIKLVVVGPIVDHNYAATFIDDCIYLGNVTEQQVAALNNAALISLCLTKWFPFEPFGLFQAEAFAAGAKVFSSGNGALGEYLVPGAFKKESKNFSLSLSRIEQLINERELSPSDIHSQATMMFSHKIVAQSYLAHMRLL